MKAAVLREFGGPEVLKLEDVATPEPGPGQLVLKVLASGTNRLEHYLREGTVTRELALPHVLGSDAAGEVAVVGEGVTGFTVGDRVIPLPGFPLDSTDDARPMSAAPSYAIGGIAAWGTYAEYVKIPAKWTVHDNTGYAPEHVATLPMVLTTAVRAVREVGAVTQSDTVLVHAGASATGSMSIQVAKALGARVITTVDDDEKTKTARSAGADEVIDVRTSDFVTSVQDWTGGRGVDVVVDNLGGTVLPQSIDATRPLGTVVSMGFVTGLDVTFHIRNFFFAQKRLLGSLMGDDADLAWGLEQVTAGTIKPVLDRALPLAEAARAHQLMADNATRGTVVLVP
ncbi:MAG: quinone oxidoreductase family protein [Phycicoccus sp.]